MENNKVQFTTSQMLKWMEYVADLKEVSPEKIKMLNTCGKRRNILATIATHKMILIFADETHSNMLYKCWEAGYGDYEMYYGTGYEPSEMKHCKVSDLMDDGISGPTVIFIVNENTRESMIFGMKNDNFSMGTVKYVGHEIRSVIMNKLELDVSDVALMVNSERHVQRVAVIGPGAGNEAVVGGIVSRGVEDTVQPQHTGVLVHLVLVLGALFDLDDRPEILGLYPRGGNIMPNIHRMFLLFQFVPWTHYSAEKRGAQRDFATLSKCFFERC